MMRVLASFIVFLFIIQQSFSETCVCHCCKTPGCTPQEVGSHYLYSCYESACTTTCTTLSYDQCVAGGTGVARGECRNGGPDRLLSPLFMVFGLTSIIMMIKNKF